MKINFVIESGRWMPCKWAEEFSARMYASTVSTEPINDGANVFINHALYKRDPQNKAPQIAVFTHKEEKNRALSNLFDSVAQQCDWCFAQSEPTLLQLPENKRSILSVGVESQFIKPQLVLGMPVKEQPNDRKRVSWAKKVGELENVSVRITGGRVKEKDMPLFYKNLDYVLITSQLEGGPMAVKEAIAMGKPLILPRGVGWCDEYPAIRYNTLEELINIVERLTYNRDSWNMGAQQILDKVTELSNGVG